MRVLWFTNILLPAVDRRLGTRTVGSGHWMTALAEALAAQGGIKLAIAAAWPGLADLHFEEAGIEYFVVGQSGKNPGLDSPEDLEKCARLVQEWKPELVHIHGTERFFGLLGARGMIEPPTLISIQGLVGACLPVYFGSLGVRDIWRMERVVDLMRGRGLLFGYRSWRKAARREEEILKGNTAFLGRTAWDQAQVWGHNPRATYDHVGEILRPAFYRTSWSLERCRRQTIFCTNGGNPRRGVETLLAGVSLLRREFPAVRLIICGEIPAKAGFGRYLRETIRRCGLEDCVEFPGHLDDEAMARALGEAHVFVTPSLIENSPNSLCEAQLAGLPCVASYVGGIPSLVNDGVTGLLFPKADAAGLACAIRRIFLDDGLAARLGKEASAEARQRHEPAAVVGQLLAAYSRALSGETGPAAVTSMKEIGTRR